MVASGYFQAAFSAVPIQFWGAPIPVWGVADVGLAGFFLTLHGIMAVILAGLILAHIGFVALNIVKQTGIAARMLPALGGKVTELVPAETTSSVAAKTVQRLAKNLRFFGWMKFWLQLALAFISGLLLIFANSGRTFSPTVIALGDGMYWAIYGFSLLCFAVLLAFYYTRAARKVVLKPDSYLNPKKRVAFWFLGTGVLTGLLGILISFTGVALSISLLIAKTVSQPPGIAITDPSKIIRALDVFVLLVNFNLLVAHFGGTGISLWLSIRASKARLEYRLIPSKLD
jgi:hypothetical protein